MEIAQSGVSKLLPQLGGTWPSLGLGVVVVRVGQGQGPPLWEGGGGLGLVLGW